MIRINTIQLASLPQRSKELVAGHAFEFLVDDGGSDLEAIVNFMTSQLGFQDEYELFRSCNERVLKCCGFDAQTIPAIADIRSTNPEQVHVLQLVQGYDYGALEPRQRKVNRESNVFEENQTDLIESSPI